MPSSEPFDTTIATFSIVSGSIASSCGCSSSSVNVSSLLHAAFGLGDAADLGCELGGALREELVELLDRDARFLAERADRRCRAGREIAVAHEPDDEPVAVAERGDAVLACDLLGELLAPLLGIGEEAFGVDVDGRLGDHHCGHLVLLSSYGRGRASCRRSASPDRSRAGRARAAGRASRSTGTAACRGD